MTTPAMIPEEFETVTEVEVDSRGRVALGKAGAAAGQRYRVDRNLDGVLVMTPVVSIPERELLVWLDSELAARIRRGVDHAKAGKTIDLGSFAKYLVEEDDEA